jgi:hypothetical protein
MTFDMTRADRNTGTPTWTLDLLLVVFLITFDVVARLLPHVPGFWPFAASALFAGRMIRTPALAFIVPLVALALSNAVLPGDDWRILAVVYIAIAIPALLGMMTKNARVIFTVPAASIAGSLIFFVLTNFAVWAFGTLYPRTWEGLVQCYIAALPFLDKTVIGDLFWAAVLFGGAALVQYAPRLSGRSV